MSLTPAPIADRITDATGKASPAWTMFFNQLSEGDQGDKWTPEFENLTVLGTPKLEAYYFRLNGIFTYFAVTITPSVSVSATAVSTYIKNFPLTLRRDGACFAVSGGAGSIAGMCVASNNRIYIPALNNVTTPITVLGLVEAN